MFCLRQPTAKQVQQLIVDQSTSSPNYVDVGLSLQGNHIPNGFRSNQRRGQIGHGETHFERAKQAISELEMLNLGWIQVVPNGTRLRENGLIATHVQVFGIHVLQVARVIYLLEEAPSNQNGYRHRFGFGYGTLPEYPMRGEERFEVSWCPKSDHVDFEIFSFSQPSTLVGQLGARYLRRKQKRFGRESIAKMREYVTQRRATQDC